MLAETDNLGRAFERFASKLPGDLVIAVATEAGEERRVLGRDRGFHGWSTIKVPVLAGLLSMVRREALTAEQHELARLAITESDNRAILELFVALERLAGGTAEAGAVIEQILRRSGDPETIVILAPPPPGAVTPFGQTRWSAAASAGFFAALAGGRLLDPADTGYMLDLMERVIPEQRWGLGTLRVPVAFKGGWGPEPDGRCLVRQSGHLRDTATAVSLVAEPPPGAASFQAGAQMISQAAGWLAGRLE